MKKLNHIKYFLIFENFTNKHVNGWNIKFNHNANHNLYDRYKNRTNCDGIEFDVIISDLTNYLNLNNSEISGNCIFYYVYLNLKICTYITNNTISISTILGGEYKTKNNDIIIKLDLDNGIINEFYKNKIMELKKCIYNL